jgi:hypothetical protein
MISIFYFDFSGTVDDFSGSLAHRRMGLLGPDVDLIPSSTGRTGRSDFHCLGIFISNI